MNENNIVFYAIQKLTRCKYIYLWNIDAVITQITTAELTKKQYNRIAKKIVRTLERLGYECRN